jgi:hypothetical protein
MKLHAKFAKKDVIPEPIRHFFITRGYVFSDTPDIASAVTSEDDTAWDFSGVLALHFSDKTATNSFQKNTRKSEKLSGYFFQTQKPLLIPEIVFRGSH